jgi:FlaG/FlaF family flagellin (archaellin)
MTRAGRWVTANRLQVAVTVLLALLLGAATWSSGKASGSWQQATRQDSRSTTLREESVRFVYQSELPLAIGLAQAQVRRDALQDLDAGTDPEVAGELDAADQLVGELRQTSEQTTDGLVNGGRYETADGGYDVPRRVGDVLRHDRVTAYDQSAASMRIGDWWARRARVLVLLALVVTAGYVVLSAVRARRRRRVRQRSEPDVGLVPTPWTEHGSGRTVAALALTAWLVLPVLTGEQLGLSMDSARSAAESARLISEVSGSAVVSQVRDGAAGDLQLQASHLSTTGLSRQYAATLDGSDGQQLIGTAENKAGERLARIGSSMTGVPTTADGVDPVTSRWLASEPSDWEAIRSRQERTQIDSEDAGSAADGVGLGLLLAALAATAATVARLPGASRRSTSLLAGGLLAAAALVAVSAVFT